MQGVFPENEEQRLQALQNYDILDSLPEERFDRLTRLAASICGVPIALVSLIDHDRQWFKSRFGLQDSQTARNISFCQHAILGAQILEIEDAAADSRFRDNPLVLGNPEIRFYAGAPLVDPQGYALGTLCVIDRQPRRLTAEQKQALADLAAEVIDGIVTRKEKAELEAAELKLADSRRRLEEIIRGTNVGTWQWNVQSGETIFDERWAGIIGYTLAEISPVSIETWQNFANPDDLQQSNTLLQKHFSGEQDFYEYESRMRHKNGQWVWVLDRGRVAEWTADGKPLWMYGTHQDITERKSVEQALSESRARYASILAAIPDLIFLFGRDGVFLDVHTSDFSRLLYLPEQFLGKNLTDVMPAAFALQILQKITEAFASKKLVVFNYELPNPKTGLIEYFEARMIAADDWRVLSIIRDVTTETRGNRELLRTKDLLTRTGQVARLGGWEYFPDDGRLYWSDVTREIHEVAQDFQPTFESGLAFYTTAEHRSRILEAVREAVETGKPYDVELQMQTAKGRNIWVRAKGAANFAEGKCTRLYGIFQDIDEQKKLSLELQRVKDQMQSIFNEMTDVVWSVDYQTFNTTFITPSVESLYGYSVAQWMTDNKLWEKVFHPDDKPILDSFTKTCSKAGFQNAPIGCSLPMVRQNGFATALNSSGMQTAIPCVSTDILRTSRWYSSNWCS